MDLQAFNREMDMFGSFVRRSTLEDAEQILLELQVKIKDELNGSYEYELCASKVFFVEQHIRKRQRNQVQRGMKPWNLV